MNEDWGGWIRAKETNGTLREWPNDRIVSSYFTEEDYDTQNDRVHLSAFLLDKASDGNSRIDWAMTNGVIGLIHGKTELGFIHIGKPLAYRKDGNKLELKYGVYKGSETVDWLWENEIKKRGMEAGLSIGGMNIEKNCDINGQCDVTKLDLWEWSYTPTPANEGAINTALNKFAKSNDNFEDSINKTLRGIDMEIDELTLKGIENILGKRKEASKPKLEKTKNEVSNKSLAKSAILKHIIQNPDKELTSWTFLKTCEPSQKYANQLDKAGLNFDEVNLQFDSMIKDLKDNLITKGWLCECKECGFTHISSDDCRSYSCPMCGSEMRKLLYPSLMKDNDDKTVLINSNEGDFPEEVPTDEAPYIDKKEKNKEAKNMPDYENMSDEEKKKYDEKMKKTSPPASPGKEEKGNGMPDDEEKKKKKKEEEMENMNYSKADIDEMKKSIASLELMIKDMQKVMKATDDEEENRVDEGEGEKGTGLPVGGEELSKKTTPGTIALPEAVDTVLKSGYTIVGIDKGAPDLSGVNQKATPGVGPGGVPNKLEKGKSNALELSMKRLSGNFDLPGGAQ